MRDNRFKGILKSIHKKDNELTERYLGRTPLFAGFWARKGLSVNIKRSALYVKGVVLDAGCGNKPYRKYFKQGIADYIGVDYSPASGYMGNNADTYADINKMPFKCNSFDTVLCFEVLEHIEEPHMLLSEFKRVIKKDGKLLLSSPFAFPVHSDGVDYFRFTAKGLKSLIERNGFNVLRITPVCGSAMALAVLFNTYVYYGCFFWNRFLYPISIIIRPFLWLLMLLINISAWILDIVFRVNFLPFGNLVIAEPR